MTDKELLHAAAKAAGMAVEWRESVGGMCYRGSPYEEVWNPLGHDGAALDLAVRLGIGLEFATGWTAAYAGSRHAKQVSERHDDDPLAATRRAIVCAAAAVAGA